MKKTKFISILFLFTAVSFVSKAQDGWVINAENIDADNYYGITSANGMLGIVSSPEPMKVKEVILGGVYDMYGRKRTNNFLPSFNLLNMEISVDWEPVTGKNISNFKQRFNLRNATFESSFDFKDELTIEYNYRSLRHLPFTVLLDMKIIAKKDVDFVCGNFLETPSSLKNDQHYFNEVDRYDLPTIQLMTTLAESPQNGIQICASNSFIFNEPMKEQPRIIHEMRDNNMHSVKFRKQLKKGEEYSFSVLGSLISSVHYAEPLNQAERLTIYAKLEGRERLIERHNQAWEKLWESDIEIEGDPKSQLEVRTMLYHLYAFNRENSGMSSSPMGLSGLGYNGHVFWDSELWMFPSLLMLQPEIARNMVDYRYDRLDAAKKNAFSYGYKGAMFPWESAHTGFEETQIRSLMGTFEHHITACVGIAAWNYYLVTGDLQWLKDKGWAILSETAEFWSSRPEKNKDGKYDIKNVVAADEWAENVDNNAFTNAAAKLNLEYAAKCAKLLNIKAPAYWKEIADNLSFSKMADGVTREHDTYTGQMIKQADVNLLAYPLKLITDNNQIRKDIEYYEQKIPETYTTTMTQSVFSIIYSRLGEKDKAYYWFQDAYQDYILPPFGVMAELRHGDNPYFITGAGGILQSIIMGFGGIDIQAEGGLKQLKTALPPNWTKLTLKGIGPDKKTYTVTK